MKDNYIYKITEVKQKYRTTRKERFKVTSPISVYDYLQPIIAENAQEVLVMLGLNTKNEVTYIYQVSQGTINASIVHPRDIFRTALMNNTASIILAHNHPSGDPTQSLEDIEATRRLQGVGELIGIEILDHIIVTEEGYTSLKEEGYL